MQTTCKIEYKIIIKCCTIKDTIYWLTEMILIIHLLQHSLINGCVKLCAFELQPSIISYFLAVSPTLATLSGTLINLCAAYGSDPGHHRVGHLPGE